MTLERADVLRRIDATFPDSPVVLTLGGTVREMIAVAGRRPNHLPNLDAMGHTIGVALGLALGLEGRAGDRVVAIEGDGSLLMGLSVVSTVGHRKPGNLVVFVLDNGVYLATGGQPTAAADIDMVAMALACGWSAGARRAHRGRVGRGAGVDPGRARAGPGARLHRDRAARDRLPPRGPGRARRGLPAMATVGGPAGRLTMSRSPTPVTAHQRYRRGGP